MKRISKKVREEAALICQVAASNNLLNWETSCTLGVSAEAYDLAVCACSFTVDAYRRWEGNELTRAEAESLLRTGWSP